MREVIVAVAAFLIFFTMLYKGIKKFWSNPKQIDAGASAREVPFALDGSSSEVTPSTPPSNDGGTSVVVRPPAPPTQLALTPREVRALSIRDRLETGLCLYCDKHASRSLPQVKLIRPLLDPLWRRLNVVPVNKWKIVTDVGVDAPFAVCDPHQEIARSHLEEYMAQNTAAYAGSVVRQRGEMFEFVEHGLDEVMDQEALRIRRKRPNAPTVAVLRTGT